MESWTKIPKWEFQGWQAQYIQQNYNPEVHYHRKISLETKQMLKGVMMCLVVPTVQQQYFQYSMLLLTTEPR
jgi:hypothetical protein